MPRYKEFDPQPTLKMDKVKEVVEKVRDDWVDRNLSDIGSTVESILSNGLVDLVKEMCGFRKDSWGRVQWEIDHCNNRSGNSLIGENIREAVRPHLEEIVTKAINGITLTKAQTDAIQKDYRDVLARAVREQAHYRANEQAREVVEQLLSGEYVVKEPKPKVTRPKSADDDFFEE